MVTMLRRFKRFARRWLKKPTPITVLHQKNGQTGSTESAWRFACNLTDNEPIQVASPTICSGWLIPLLGQTVDAIEAWVEGECTAGARLRLRRPDVQDAFPDHPEALWSGFDMEVALDRWVDRSVELALIARVNSERHCLLKTSITVTGRTGEQRRRARAFDLNSLLACPMCKAERLNLRATNIACGSCGATFEVRRGTPLFTPASCPVASRLLERSHTHEYSEESLALIRQNPNGLVLDFGAGNPAAAQHYPNVVFHEAVHYAQTDVVNALHHLPYRDRVFDAVLSQAVFEHVTRPWETAAELFRVLKPGGRIHIDTAFMQPMHADPCHYFNMTLSGVREVFRDFTELAAGVKPYQQVSYGLRMHWDIMLDHLRPGKWKDRLQQVRAALDKEDIDRELDAYGQQVLAAGVYFDGMRPLAA